MKCKKICLTSHKKCRRNAQNGNRYCWQHNTSFSQSRSSQFGGALLTTATKFNQPKKGQWDIYGKGYCPHTQRAVNYVHRQFTEPVVFYDITTFKPPLTTEQLKRKLVRVKNHNTVPMIFDPQNKFIGGANDLFK